MVGKIASGVGLLAGLSLSAAAWAEPASPVDPATRPEGKSPARRFDTHMPEPGNGYDWKDAAREIGLSEEDIAALTKDQVLLGRGAYRQVFTPYIGSSLPVFITSDSLLNVYHVLFEESLFRMEAANAAKLAPTLREFWKGLEKVAADTKGDAKLLESATRRARITLGVALTVLGEKAFKPDEKIAAVIAEEAKRVESGEGASKPDWLGPPDAQLVALDYSRYKPRGFYARCQASQRYFRAVSWLQSIPFRVDKDEELVAIWMLGQAVPQSIIGKEHLDGVGIFSCYRDFLGLGDDLDVISAVRLGYVDKVDAEGLKRLRGGMQWVMARDSGPQINDQLRFPPRYRDTVTEPNFRFISAYRTPDALLFQRTTDMPGVKRDFPTGLEVCAALGSPFARGRLAELPDGRNVIETIERNKALFSQPSLYCQYLDCLAALLTRPDPDAPAFMTGQAWQAKSCQTALAGWAQLRHSWSLQAKENANWFCATLIPPGFVEPNPEFFARMGRLIRRTERMVLKQDLRLSPAFLAEDYRAAARLVEGASKGGHKSLPRRGQPFGDIIARAVDDLDIKQESTTNPDGSVSVTWVQHWGHDGPWAADSADWAQVIERLRAVAEDLEQGKRTDLTTGFEPDQADLESRWRQLGELCANLETLCHKQLRGLPLEPAEEKFIKGYGESLAHLFSYAGNSYMTPRDDAPRIVDVYVSPTAPSPYLHVGIGRPRAMYVLYPTRKGDILCRGAILPYFEFGHAQRLADWEWKTLLDSKSPPDSPGWVKTIPSVATTTQPDAGRRPNP